MFGPSLERLRFNGFCCVCLEDEEEHAARIADLSLKSVPIRWYRKIKTDIVKNDASAGFLAALGCANPKVEPLNAPFSDGANGQLLLSTTTPYIGVNARIELIDSSHGPAMQVTTRDYQFIDDDEAVGCGDGTVTESDTPVMIKVIPLTEIDVVSAANADEWNTLGLGHVCRSGIIMRGSSGKGKRADTTGRKLLVFDVVRTSVHSMPRDEVVRHLNNVVSWGKGSKISTGTDVSWGTDSNTKPNAKQDGKPILHPVKTDNRSTTGVKKVASDVTEKKNNKQRRPSSPKI